MFGEKNGTTEEKIEEFRPEDVEKIGEQNGTHSGKN